MMETAVIVALTLCAVIVIPWMMKRDYEKRMLCALKAELIHNITLLKNCIGNTTDVSADGDTPGLPVLKDGVFRKIQQADFHSNGLSQEDRDALEKVFVVFSRRMKDIPERGRVELCTENMGVLEGIAARIADYIKDEKSQVISSREDITTST